LKWWGEAKIEATAKGGRVMKTMKTTIGITVALLVGIGAGVALAHDEHVRTGIVVGAGATSVILLDEGRRLTLILDGETAVADELGRPIAAAGLGKGDYVREECRKMADGRSVARRITVLQPAWRAITSPES
jgi:hypothetical protein